MNELACMSHAIYSWAFFLGPSTGCCITPSPCCFCWDSEHLYPVMGCVYWASFISKLVSVGAPLLLCPFVNLMVLLVRR